MSHRSDIRSPLAKVRGLGSAHSGTHHWWLERLTSLALVPLTLWFMVGLITHLGAPRVEVVAWLSQPFVSIVLFALVVALFWHVRLGLQVIIEDYVHTDMRKVTLLLFKDVCVFVLGMMCVFAIVKLQFIGIT